jgi:reactive intermediate/imine deaminase
MSEPTYHMVDGAPAPVAPYSHAVEADGWVYVTGQMPTQPDGTLPDGIEAQTRQVIENLSTVLRGVGLGLGHVVFSRVYLTHFKDEFARMNEVYASYFPEGQRPGRTCVGVTDLALDARVEIDLVARRSEA